jgi:D-glycero-alpha-D-manno-heptose-7-phosphate kinase
VTSSALAVAPLRISFVGGGSDLESYFREIEGAVVSCAINKYVFVHAKLHDDSFGERYRISYSKVEHVQEVSQIENEIVRHCLEFMQIDSPVQISTLSDLPAGTGMGSSSSFTVALLLALHELKGQKPTKHQLAEEACHVEIKLLNHPIGKQDQYAASFGGLNFFKFKTNGKVSVEPISISSNELSKFLGRCRLFWTRTERSAVRILTDQAERSNSNMLHMQKMVSLAYEFRQNLQEECIEWESLADLINKSWDIKQSFSPMISSAEIQEMIREIKGQDSTGVKLLGAGGGGFILAFNGGEQNLNIVNLNAGEVASSFIPNIDHQGARIISTF